MDFKNHKKPLIILTGPTAVGKTDLSIRLAKAINGQIISADSIQVYKYMDIGSAKATEAEMDGVKHYLIDEFMPDDEFNIYIFKEKAAKYAEEIYKNGKIPIIAGGTGFYIQSLLYDIEFSSEDNDKSYRDYLEKLAKTEGAKHIHNMLSLVDPKSAKDIHPNNVKRVIRALEYYKLTGEKISSHNQEQQQHSSPYNFKYFVLNMNRELLYERINYRVDKMISDGLVAEVEQLMSLGYGRDLVSMQGIGYKEIASYIDGECSIDEAVDTIKKNTRHFAKRQLTWFRRERDVEFIDYEAFEFDKDRILHYLVESINTIL